ncbi:MAG: DNA (cytosine-5-)-methyltransferase [Bacteroidales bacterium]|jgi:DNA-cytosine methyltransferase|nr:DNA (cytosine-5-)-methyltransferase [Bacteroidales bacterium]
MTHGSLFSGIGGFDLAAQWCGWRNVFQCENNEFCRKVLKYNFPESILYEDIKETDFTGHKGTIDVISGGFPCQDISIAGYKKGIYAEKSGLFFEMLRAVDEIRPRYVVWENVARIRKYLPVIVSAYSQIGFSSQWCTVCASWIGFPHKRERIFGIVYNTDVFGFDKIRIFARSIEKAIHEASQREFSRANGWLLWLENYGEFLQEDDGIPGKLVKNEIGAYGNAVVPEIARIIFNSIEQNKQIP